MAAPRNLPASNFRTFVLLLGYFCFSLNAQVASADSAPDGKTLWTQRCSACHTLNPPPTLAPPVRGIVMNYSQKYADRDAFTKAVADFVHSPATVDALMPDAKKRFGVMPPFPYEESELRAIASWMWDEIKARPFTVESSSSASP